MTCQALSQPSVVSSPHPRRTGSPSLAEDPVRCDETPGGLASLAGGIQESFPPAHSVVSSQVGYISNRRTPMPERVLPYLPGNDGFNESGSGTLNSTGA